MDHIGIDVHKRESQIYILAESGEVIERRIRTEPERFDAVLGTRPRARIVIEASTDSEWVARCLDLARPRRIHGREVRVSATMTSWPSASRQRATHSLSVEASITIRARGRVPSTASKRAGSVRMRRSMTSPPSARI